MAVAQSPFQRFVQRLIRPSAPTPAAAREVANTSSPGAVLGRESWNLGGMPFISPYSAVPLVESYKNYELFAESVPLIDAALVHTVELVGTPCIEAEEDVKADLEEWLERLIVNRVQTGLGPMIETWLGNMLTYGRGHMEIVLSNARDDIYSLNPLHPSTIGFVPANDGVTLQTVQFGRTTPLVFPDWKVLNAVNRVRGDNPNGTSMIWGTSLVAECYVTMVRSQQGLYTRFGDPSYHFDITPPDALNDPNGTVMQRLVQDMRNQFDALIASRKNGKTRDIFTTATTATILGAGGEELMFNESSRSILEQLVAKFGLPPLIFGLAWSTTERMSTVQSGLLAEMVDRYQKILTGPLLRMIRLRQMLAGKDPNVKLHWEGANLQDRMMDAQADAEEETARKLAWENDLKLRRQGMLTPVEWLKRARPDLADLDEADILDRLPEFDPEPPEEAPPMPFGGPAGQQNGGAPGRGQGPNDNRPPGPHRSISYSELWETANGNGNGHR